MQIRLYFSIIYKRYFFCGKLLNERSKSMKCKNIAIVGFGGVGKAFFQLIKNHAAYKVVSIINSRGGIYNSNGINEVIDKWSESITFQEMMDHHHIDIVIELTPSNHLSGQPGLSYIKKALEHKKHVVTGNKGPFLFEYNRLFDLAKKNNVCLKIGCTVGGALPSLVLGEKGLLGGQILEIQGVLNGTSNLILDLMTQEKLSFDQALEKAVELKIAEKDCSLDVNGYDTAAKLMILSQKFLGPIAFKDIEVEGIQGYENIKKLDLEKVRLVGQASRTSQGVKARVGLKVLSPEDPLYHVSGNNKGVTYETDLFGSVTVTGGASGLMPAAGAILRDLLSI